MKIEKYYIQVTAMDICYTECSYHNLRNNDILCLFLDNSDDKALYRVSRHTASTVWIYPFTRGKNIRNLYIEFIDEKSTMLERRLMKGEYRGYRVDTVYRDYTTLYVENWGVYAVFAEEEEEEEEKENPFIDEQPPNA